MTSVLPDVVAPDLDIVFCGTAAGTASALRKAYYAGPGNAFWPTLHRVGLTPRQLKPEEFRSVTRWKLGLTDLVKEAYGSDATLKKADFCARALEDLVRLYQPKLVAFTSKRAAEEYFGSKVSYGLQRETCGGALIFVLPSPSGLARKSWNEGYWLELSKLSASAGGK